MPCLPFMPLRRHPRSAPAAAIVWQVPCLPIMPLRRHPRSARADAILWQVRLNRGAHSIELSLHVCFVLTLLTMTWLLGQALFPRAFPGWAPHAYWLVAASVALTDSAAGLFHELGHALAALAKGRRVYRITLYGLAAAAVRSAGPTRPRDQVAIAVAGPLSHLLVASALWATWSFLPADNQPLRVAMGLPALSNFATGLLNLLPFSPLDGGRAVRALVAAILRV